MTDSCHELLRVSELKVGRENAFTLLYRASVDCWTARLGRRGTCIQRHGDRAILGGSSRYWLYL